MRPLLAVVLSVASLLALGGCLVPHWGANPPGNLTVTPPPPPEPHSHTVLAGGRGYAYVLDRDLWVVAPGRAAERVLTFGDGASLVLVDPALRFVLLHERVWPADDARGFSRLAMRTIGQEVRHVLVEPFYDFDLRALLAPDGRTLYVRAPLSRREEGGARASHLIADLGQAAPATRAWLDGAALQPIGWAPRGLMMAFWREVPMSPRVKAEGQVELLVATPEDAEARLVAAVAQAGGRGPQWLADGERLATAWSRAKYEGILHTAIIRVADGQVEPHDIDLTDGRGSGFVHVEALEASPDGRRWLAMRHEIGAEATSVAIVVEAATGLWSRVGDLGVAWRWTAAGDIECRSAEDGPWQTCP